MLWWLVPGIVGVFLYVILLMIWGLGCIQKSRYLWFVLGIFLPILWIIGNSRPQEEHAAQAT